MTKEEKSRTIRKADAEVWLQENKYLWSRSRIENRTGENNFEITDVMAAFANDCRNKPLSSPTINMKFEVEKSTLPFLEGVLLLKSNVGHCYLQETVKDLLNSPIFKNSNPDLVPIYEKGLDMMKKGITGIVCLTPIYTQQR